MTSNIVVTTTITPEQATVMLAETAYEGQRKIRPEHVKYLAEEMRRGNFKPRTLIVIARQNGRQQLLDGQHRLGAVIASGMPQVFLISYEDYTEEEIKNAYIRIDQGLTRTAVDKYAVLGLPDELGLTFTQVNKLAGACRFLYYGFSWKPGAKHRIHDDELLTLMRTYAEPCRNYFTDIHGLSYDLDASLRSATLGLAMVTYRHAEGSDYSRTVDFWKATVSGEGLTPGDPRFVAFRHLISAGMPGGGGGGHGRTVTPMYSIRFLAKCYNSWMIGEERKTVQMRDGDETKPFAIFGTPFDGKEHPKPT